MTANLKIGPCPKCGNTTFITTAHVTQTWLVDEDGDFIEAKYDCDEVTHAPDAEDLFICIQRIISRILLQNHSYIPSLKNRHDLTIC